MHNKFFQKGWGIGPHLAFLFWLERLLCVGGDALFFAHVILHKSIPALVPWQELPVKPAGTEVIKTELPYWRDQAMSSLFRLKNTVKLRHAGFEHGAFARLCFLQQDPQNP